MNPLEKGTFGKPQSAIQAQYAKHNPDEEVWLNDIYQVNVRRGIPLSSDPEITVTHLSIKRRDKQANMDWRHLQLIKNQLVGPENEGCELFPAESRLVDNANQYHMWVFENPDIKFPFGFQTRLVTESSRDGSVQRKWDKSERPKDVDEHEKIMDKMYEKAKDGTLYEDNGT